MNLEEKNCPIVKSSETYFVDKILNKKLFNGKVKYKVKWLGFSKSQSTWEPEENLATVPDLIDLYNKNLKSKVDNRSNI